MKYLKYILIFFVSFVFAESTNLIVNTRTIYDTNSGLKIYNPAGLILTNGGWEDLRFPATSINPAGPAAPATADATNPGLTFAGNADNAIHLIAQMPHSKALGSSVSAHIHVESEGTATTTQNWQMISMWRTNGETANYTTGWTTNDFYFVPDGTANKMTRINCGTLAAPAVETLSSIIQFKLFRLGSADPNNDNARLIEFDLHYRNDGLGSDQEASKGF